MRQKNLILDVVQLMLSFVSLTYFSKLPETKLEKTSVLPFSPGAAQLLVHGVLLLCRRRRCRAPL